MQFDGMEPQVNQVRRHRRQRKSLGHNRQQLLRRYEKELKDLLSNKPTQQQKHVEPLRSHLFLDWGDRTTPQKKVHSKKKVSPQHSQQHSEMTKCAERLSNHPTYKFRQSDELIVNRYSTSVEPMSHLVKRTKDKSQKPHYKNYSTIENAKKSPVVVSLPILKDKAEKIKIETENQHQNQQTIATQGQVQTKRTKPYKGIHITEGAHTVSDYRPSRKRKEIKSFDLNTLENYHKPSLDSHQNLLFRSEVKEQEIEIRKYNNTEPRKSEPSEYSRSQEIADLGKKTIFYKKLVSEKEATKQSLAAICKKHIKPTAIPPKQSLPSFFNNYVSLDPTFDFQEILARPTFTILQFKDSLYLGQITPGPQGRKLRHGRGVFLTSKAHFEGEFQEGQKKYGMELTEEGVYKGQFQDNMRNGKGEFRWHNGEYYNGEWSANKKHGSGIWTSSATPSSQVPDSYMGEWEHGNVHGYGVHTWNNGRSRYEGEFSSFLKNGRGVEKFENGDRYEGHYRDGKAQGYGEYFWKDGSFYKGEFAAGLRQGQGVWQEVTNNRYQGFLKEDCKHGAGVMYYSNGDIFEGSFFMNSRQGPGKLKLASSGDVIQGIWKNNELVTQL